MVEYAGQIESAKEKTKDTIISKYGSNEAFYGIINEHSRKTRELNYGTVEESYKVGLEKQSKVIQEKYGVPYACMREEARAFTNDSKPNNEFANMLLSLGIKYDREFSINRYSYDFRVGSNLIEINPFSTHNSSWGLFSEEDKKDINYHYNKTQCAVSNGFRCIHVWDWDDINKVVNIILPKTKLYARKLIIKEIDKKSTDEFLNKNHLQNTCRNQTIRVGLYNGEELIQLMTFGRPRYNKNYEYELLRLCTKSEYIVIGGAERLFNYFKKTYSPKSVISYCDNSKFNGSVYTRIGFTLESYGSPSCHWYRSKDKKHFTDNLLRQRGADQLIGTSYGKGSNNEEIMTKEKFVKIYDCGQSTYIYNKEKI